MFFYSRFECRWSAVKITEDKSDVWFRGMGGSVLGVWVAHGEGRFTVSEPRLLDKLQDNGQIAMQYVDDDGEPTEVYPMNPNGSPGHYCLFILLPKACYRIYVQQY